MTRIAHRSSCRYLICYILNKISVFEGVMEKVYGYFFLIRKLNLFILINEYGTVCKSYKKTGVI